MGQNSSYRRPLRKRVPSRWCNEKKQTPGCHRERFRNLDLCHDIQLDYSQFFYGGGFSSGDGSSYNASTVVQRSIELNEPIIYVNFNYRVNAFGFLGGKQALAGGAANVGLYDRECRFGD